MQVEKSKSYCCNGNNERETNIATETRTRDDTSRGKHSETILSLRANLTMCVDTEYGLLDELFGLKVITCQQLTRYRVKPTKASRVEHLLNLIVAECRTSNRSSF
jgi:hypothetical protein